PTADSSSQSIRRRPRRGCRLCAVRSRPEIDAVVASPLGGVCEVRMRAILLPALAALALCSGTTPAVAAAAFDTTAVQYGLLTPPSAYETGCFGPCDCAVAMQPTYGSFLLAQTSAGPLYDEYDVRGYIASFNNGPGVVSIQGSGHYRVGGEVALQQQLTMD